MRRTRPWLLVLIGAGSMLTMLVAGFGAIWFFADGDLALLFRRNDAPWKVARVLRAIDERQRRHFVSLGSWATSLDDLEYDAPSDFGYAICIPTDCRQPAGREIVVPVTLSAHLAVADCLAAVVGPDTRNELWVLYRDGSIRSDGPCVNP